MPPLTGIENGGYTNKPDVSLGIAKPDPAYNIYYTMSVNGSDPGDPVTSSQLFPGSLLFTGEPSAETTIRLKFLPVNRITKVSGPVTEYRFTIDLLPPEAPEFVFKDNDLFIEGEGTVYYTIDENGIEPALPSTGSSRYYDKIYLNGYEGKRTAYTVSAVTYDKSGNRSPVAGPKTFVIDKRIPDLPDISGAEYGISYNTDNIRIRRDLSDTEVKVYYTFTIDGSDPPLPDLGSPVLNESISFTGVPNEETVCRIKFLPYSTENHNKGSVSELRFTIDLRPPALPVPKGFTSGSVSNTAVLLDVLREDPEDQVFIGLSETGQDIPDPFDALGTLMPEEFFLNVEPGTEHTYYFTFGAMDNAGNRTINEEVYSVTIDKKAPDMPLVTGVTDGGVYNRAVRIGLGSGDTSDEILYVLSNYPLERDADISSMGKVYTGTLTADIPKGEEQWFILDALVKDKAGNTSQESLRLSFSIDKIAPSSPVFEGVPENGITAQPVQITFDNAGAGVYYELSTDGRQPQLPGRGSSRYSEPLTFSGEPDKEVSYVISAVSTDSAGNMSLSPSMISFTIDRKIPPEPDKPEIDKSLLHRGLIQVAWDAPPEGNLFYRVDGNGEDEVFSLFDAPFFITVPEDKESVSLFYFVSDTAGNRSRESKIRILLPKRDVPLVRGITDGKTYSENISMVKNVTNGIVRYEITEPPETVKQVNRFSPMLENGLVLDTAYGETNRYMVSVALFADTEDQSTLKKEFYSIAIDKSPPPSPSIQGVEQEQYYQSDVTISISHTEGTLFYQLSNTTAGDDPAAAGKFTEYVQPLKIKSKPGEFASYRVTAFTADEAGNRSSEKIVAFYIDREIIYVSGRGNDLYIGSREKPFRSIRKAFYQSETTGRKTIFISTGEYLFRGPLILDTDITIVGGFNPDTWEKSETVSTIIKRNESYPDDTPLMWMRGGKIIVRDLQLSAEKESSVLIRTSAGETSLSGLTLSVDSCSGTNVIDHRAGRLWITGSTFKTYSSDTPVMLYSAGKSLAVSESVFEADDNSKYTAVVLKNLESADFSFVTMMPGTGEHTTGIVSFQTDIRMENVTLSTGKGSADAFGLRLEGGSLSLHKSVLNGEGGARVSTLLYADDARIDIDESILDAGAYGGAIALHVKDSRLNLIRSTVKSKETREFIYFVKSVRSTGLVSNNHFIGSSSGDVIVCESASSSLDIFNNTILGLEGKRMTLGFRISGDRGSRIINNIVISNNRANSTAVAVLGSSTVPEIRANNFARWKTILAYGNAMYTSMDALNSSDGYPFGGRIHKNIEEEVQNTFIVSKDSELKLKQSSLCVDGGIDVKPLGGDAVDWENEKRPNPDQGIKPTYDIGADEYY